MNKKYLGLGICSVAISVLLASIIVIVNDKYATGAYLFGVISGVLLISGLYLIVESKKLRAE